MKGKSGRIVDVREGRGKEHDFSLFKRTIGSDIHEEIPICTDLGYMGIAKLHANSIIPRKESKHHPLSEKDKAYNKRLGRKRIIVEHINAKIKKLSLLRKAPFSGFLSFYDFIIRYAIKNYGFLKH